MNLLYLQGIFNSLNIYSVSIKELLSAPVDNSAMDLFQMGITPINLIARFTMFYLNQWKIDKFHFYYNLG